MTLPRWFPQTVHAPQTVQELGDLVRHARSTGQAIYPVGGRTMLELGMPPTRPGVAIDLTKLNQVIDYPARDMTVTVQAGITIDQLSEVLAKEGQRLPIDVPLPHLATLGGAIAGNVSGPRRYGFGTLRDYVIGITVINDEGKETKAGGRVVKNVAGYDLCKLYVGSLGTLGIITQVTLKLKPLPEANELVAIDVPSNKLGALLDRLHGSRTQPMSMTALSTPSSDWRVLVGFEGSQEAVHWQHNQLQQELVPHWSMSQSWSGVASRSTWDGLRDFSLQAGGEATFKANVLASAAAKFCNSAADLLGGSGSIQAEVGNGIVWGHLSEGAGLESARGRIKVLRKQAVAAQGNLIVTRCPDDWREELGVWGEPRGDQWLMRTVKQHLDPDNVFNPGRFVGGI